MLGIEQKKGDPNKLLGRLVVYAKIAPNADTNNGMGPLKDMIKNNLLAVSGEFKDTSFKDFIHREMSSNSNSEGFAEFIEHLRSEEHTSELQSRPHLVCRLLLEKKKKKKHIHKTHINIH